MDKNTKLINFIKGIIIIALAVLIVVGALKILTLKSEDGINQFDAFYKQEDNTVDVIFLGSSHVFCDIATGVLWDNYGMASFDLAGAEAPAWVSYYQLKEALRHQRPKLICFEASVADDIYYQKDEWAADNSFGMKWNSNRIEQLRVNSEGDDFYKRLNPYNIMHGRYKDLEENDFRDIRNTANYKGFDPRENIVPEEAPEIDDITECEPCPEKAEEYIRKIIELAKQENIPIVLFISPYGVNEHEQKVFNYIGTIAESEGVEFIDYNRHIKEMGLDYATDIGDAAHLNYTGNYKFSDYLGKTLKERYDIPDRRGDDRYSSWDWDAAFQRNERCDLKIKNSNDLTDIMSLTQYEYLVFAVSDGSAVIFDNNVPVESSEGHFRLTYKCGNDSFLFLDEEEGSVHTCSLFVNDTEYKEEYGNIIFVYDKVTHRFIKAMRY